MDNVTINTAPDTAKTEEKPVKVITNFSIARSLIKDYGFGKDLIDVKPSRNREGAFVFCFYDGLALRNAWQEIVYRRKKAREERQQKVTEEVKEPLEQED